MDVPKRLDERILVDTRAAQLPRPVTTGADQPACNLNELGTQRLDPIWLHSLRQAEAAKPIVEVVRQHGQLQFHDVGFIIGTAHLVASESVLGFLDEILHVAALKVEANDILRRYRHVRGNKRELKDEFARRTLHLHHHPASMTPRIRFV